MLKIVTRIPLLTEGKTNSLHKKPPLGFVSKGGIILYLFFDFAVLIDAISIRRMLPQSCKYSLAIASGSSSAFYISSSQYSVS